MSVDPREVSTTREHLRAETLADRRLSRRRFLRGAGTAVALPFLPSGLLRQAHSAALSAAVTTSQPPLRLAFFFIPNGVHMPAWRPVTPGDRLVLPSTLEPLAAVSEKLCVLSGLAHDTGFAHGDGAGDHARNAATFLTGVHPVKTDGKGIRVGVSVDQIAAQALAGKTRFASLELGMEPGRNAGSCDSGYSCAYSHNISWRSPNTPAQKEIDPQLLFDRLFGGGNAADQQQARALRTSLHKSVLDAVSDQAQQLRRELSGDDRHKLDEYLDGVREVELRLQRADQHATALERDLPLPERPAEVPTNYAQRMRLMSDLMVLALRTDQTRVITMMYGNAGSGLAYPDLQITEGHHNLSHHKDLPENLERLAKINRYHIELFSYFLQRLDAIPEGEGTLLDQCAIVYGSGLSDGNRHNHNDLPILVAGGGQGLFEGGRHVRYPDDTPLMNLYLRMLQHAGLKIDRVGDSTRPLDRLS
jgi:hypothetical protein